MIADQARMRRDLQPIRPGDEAAIELTLLTEHRAGLVEGRTRTINRLKSLLNRMFPALERALDMGTVGALVLLSGYQSPAAIRRTGKRRLATWLRNRKVRTPRPSRPRPWKPPSASTPLSPGRRPSRRWCTPWRRR